MVKIETMKQIATINKYKWQSKNEALTAMLNAYLPTNGPSGADPNPDLTAARNIVAIFGGEILHADPTEYVEGRIY